MNTDVTKWKSLRSVALLRYSLNLHTLVTVAILRKDHSFVFYYNMSETNTKRQKFLHLPVSSVRNGK